ncbi:sirohydrochlorin cobaltochelatase [Sulfurospirillum barnesii]|uniref:Cobalamin biosynthesis protein CbiK, Co2+ chelatase n=1 Tax=Sulfurospirillum barnesii (strain ATCC 700032 / DSM 10660 / SES-3) TaxID=760154 RepID=I3XZM4_SULBS|nr:sirohydrochlorin cobaltochelatase [Sulfurospirillum barnesii]AFL69398.1 cobalamin biosynthesis protein CbiK, Co2+ chelatase [Sulfurospirillum barnesii SES-3]
MKRYRHYKKDKAIVLSVFGSVIEQDKYEKLKAHIASVFEGVDLFLAIGSRMVLKALLKEGITCKTLAQTLADVDMLGYKNVIVASINLFPTCEHELVHKTVEGFKKFSPAQFRTTPAIFSKAKETTLFLKSLDEALYKEDTANLYIIHGSPKLELGGLESISYSAKFLEQKRPNNYTCSLEGMFPFAAIHEELIAKMKQNGVLKVQIIPLLLVSGNHYINDMAEIQEHLSEHFETSLAPSLNHDEKFNLLGLSQTLDIIENHIKEEMIKIGH